MHLYVIACEPMQKYTQITLKRTQTHENAHKYTQKRTQTHVNAFTRIKYTQTYLKSTRTRVKT